ncbi:unnamed protein product [Arabidopsis halleri]
MTVKKLGVFGRFTVKQSSHFKSPFLLPIHTSTNKFVSCVHLSVGSIWLFIE